MEVTRKEIIKQVRSRLDEINDNDSDMDATLDETSLDVLILDLALEALRFVNSNADINLLEPDALIVSNNTTSTGVTYSVSTSMVKGRAVGVFSVPAKFFRLVKASNGSWQKEACEAISDKDPQWHKLLDPYLTGIPEDPKVGVKPVFARQNSKVATTREVILFTIEKVDDEYPVSSIAYVVDPEWLTVNLSPNAEVEDSQKYSLNISRYLTEAFYYYLSALVLSTMGDNRSQNALSMAMTLMGAQIAQQET